MATRRKKASGTGSPSTNTDLLRVELDEIFKEYPEGAELAYRFLTAETDRPYVEIWNGDDTWRVRRDCVDRFVNGVSDRVQLKCLENSKSTEP